MLLMAYEEEPDTTDWCEETDVADFKINTAIRFSTNAGLKKLGRGQTAEHANAEDTAETYKAARYAKQFVIDDQDIIDDSMGAFSDVPVEFGKAAAPAAAGPGLRDGPVQPDHGRHRPGVQLDRPDDRRRPRQLRGRRHHGPGRAAGRRDAAARHHQDAAAVPRHRPQQGAAEHRPRGAAVPPELQFTAEILLQSAERIISTSDGGTFNPLKGKLRPVVETRLGTVGVTDPDSGTAYTGTAVNYWLFSPAPACTPASPTAAAPTASPCSAASCWTRASGASAGTWPWTSA
jgi:hypothetical protein